MTTLPVVVLDGTPTPVRSFTAYADARAEVVGLYRLHVEHVDGTLERHWTRATGIAEYVRLRRIT